MQASASADGCYKSGAPGTRRMKDCAVPASLSSFFRATTLAFVPAIVGACGGGGGGSDGGGNPPAAPAVIDAGNAATITREVLDAGLGAGSFGAAVGGGGILAGDSSANAAVLGLPRQRKTIQLAQTTVKPSVTIPAETFDCLVTGTVRLSGSVANADTLTAGDRISADFNGCDDAEGAVIDGGLRIDVTGFSGDIFSDQYVLEARVTLTNLSIAEDGDSVTGSGVFDLDLDLTVPLVSDMTVSGALLETSSGSNFWSLRDFAITILEDGTGIQLQTQYSATGTLEAAAFAGAVDFVTVVPLLATGDDHPLTGEVLITGADGATIRATVLDAQTIQLAIDLDGNGVVDETQDMSWSAVGGLGAAFYMADPVPAPLP